ncbi:hypothetical protein ACFT5C_18835 [Streptomyces sp. NPDC057116]
MHDDDNIMESFRRLLDDLDAARAELQGFGPHEGHFGALPPTAVGPPPPGPVERRHAPQPPHPPLGPPQQVTVEPLWARDTAPPERERYADSPSRRGRWAGVGVCGAGAVGGLLVVSSMLANGALTSGEPGPAARPDRPAHQDVQDSQGPGRAERETPRRTYRMPQPRTGGWSRGHHTIEVQAVAARFQVPPAGSR